MADCGDRYVPRPRPSGDRPTGEVPRADVEHLIAGVLHAQYCDGDDYAGDPSVARADRAGHAWDARLICDEFEDRGWVVHRENRRQR